MMDAVVPGKMSRYTVFFTAAEVLRFDAVTMASVLFSQPYLRGTAQSVHALYSC